MNPDQPAPDAFETLEKITAWANPLLPGYDPAPYAHGRLPRSGDLVAFETGNGFRYEGIAHVEDHGTETIIRLEETAESASRRNDVIRGGRVPEWIVDLRAP